MTRVSDTILSPQGLRSRLFQHPVESLRISASLRVSSVDRVRRRGRDQLFAGFHTLSVAVQFNSRPLTYSH